MRALFIGGKVDNFELDLQDSKDPPARYPESSGSGLHRYKLYRTARRGGEVLYAIYVVPEMANDDVDRIIAERGYERRFGG